MQPTTREHIDFTCISTKAKQAALQKLLTNYHYQDITNYSTFQEGAAVTKLTPNEKFSYKPDNRYWIKNAKGKYVNVTTIKMLQKNFPAKNVKAFCEENNLVHTKHADMLKILEYCFR